jgi:hypothetical protein
MPTSVYDEFMALYPEGTGFDPLQATQVYPFLAKHMGIMLPRAGQDGSLRAAEENLQFDYGGAAGLGFALAVASGTDSVEDIRVELARLVRKSALRCCADFDGLVSGNDVRIMAPAQYGQTFDYQEDLTVDLTVEGAVEGAVEGGGRWLHLNPRLICTPFSCQPCYSGPTRWVWTRSRSTQWMAKKISSR